MTAYLAAKPKDIHYSPKAILIDTLPFVQSPVDGEVPVDEKYPSLDRYTTCPIFAETGECRHGLKCRFLGAHVRTNEQGMLSLIHDELRKSQSVAMSQELNFISPDTLKLLRSNKVRVTLLC
jgi:tRNA-dihydrouridine synthase 3